MRQNDVRATAWFLLADAAGNPRAETFLRTLAGTLNPNKIQAAYRLQDKLAGRIGDAGDAGDSGSSGDTDETRE